VIRYHRNRFRGAANVEPGTPRHELGIQSKEDACQRTLDVWAFGEAGASLGFATGRLFDELDPLSREKDAFFEKNGIAGVRAQMKTVAGWEKTAMALLPKGLEAVRADRMAHYALTESVANVMCPACKLWCTGWSATMMREAVAIVGGYGITEDCPGFLMNKWMDCQLEATYEGPEAVQRRQMSVTMMNELFIEQFKQWTSEMKAVAQSHPDLGAQSVAASMDAWLWLKDHLQETQDANGAKLYHGNRQAVTFAMADIMAWILAARYFILDVLELEAKGPESPTVADGLDGLLRFYKDMSAVFAGRMAGEVTRLGGELVLGYQSAPAAPEAWQKLRAGLDASLAGVRLAKDRAGDALTKVMIPEALDYPL
jgi:alkylation response protein AidB-like acyl-CoA dehydrogenase